MDFLITDLVLGDGKAQDSNPFHAYDGSTESDAFLIDLAARCSKNIYEQAEQIQTLRYSSVKLLDVIKPSGDGLIKATAIYLAERASVEGLNKTIVVAVRGSKGWIDWVVNANNSSEPVSEFIVRML
jgi:hypothetical protein